MPEAKVSVNHGLKCARVAPKLSIMGSIKKNVKNVSTIEYTELLKMELKRYAIASIANTYAKAYRNERLVFAAMLPSIAITAITVTA
jgi:hypothetical protein